MNVPDNATNNAAFVPAVATNKYSSCRKALIDEDAGDLPPESLLNFIAALGVFDGLIDAFDMKIVGI